MEILIENYNNLESLSYSIEDKKINFLFGISGSGKSSIAQAMSNDSRIDHLPFGKNVTPKVLINNEGINDDNCFKLFNLDYMNNVLIEKTRNDEIYSVIIGNDSEIEEIKSQYTVAIDHLVKSKNEIFKIEGKISTLINDLKIEYSSRTNEYKSTCLLKKLETNIDNKKGNYVKSKKYSSSRIKWYIDGTNTDEYKNGECPYCGRKMSSGKINNINKIIVFDAKTYEKINSYSGIFNELGIQEPNWIRKSEVKVFNKKIHDCYSMLPELKELVSYINICNNSELSISNLKKINISKELKKIYPDIADSINEFNKEFEIIRKKLVNLKKKTDNIISSNLKEINSNLEILGITYRFSNKKIDTQQKKSGFLYQIKI